MTASLDALVASQARDHGDRLAIVDGERRLRYAELDALANRVARVLAATGAQRGDRVALLAHKSIEAIAVMLGTMRAGLVYVPLDPASPPARAVKILARCRPGILVVAKGLEESARKLRAEPEFPSETRDGFLSDDPQASASAVAFGGTDVDAASSDPVLSPARRADPAHILFTSGSTGIPKGVVVPHGSVLDFVAWANEHLDVRPGDRVSGHSPLFFDLSSYDIYGAFAAGAELHLVPAGLNLIPAKLAAFIRERKLTHWFSVPSILSYMLRFDAVRQDDFPELRRLHWCGEVFPTPPLRALMARLPHVTFTNLYGPTETTIASSYFTLAEIPASDRDDVPIGMPCGGESLAIVDDALGLVPDGVIGELVIGGAGLTLGYWEDPETTARAFVTIDAPGGPARVYRTGDLARRDPSGLVYFLGRKDSQIKSRGYRIELGEIETALHSLPELADAAVVAIPTEGFEGHAICCAFEPRSPGVDAVALRGALGKLVPSYMIPARWKMFASLPRTANGKTDRKALRELFAQGGSDHEPR